ncbi:antirepressor [Limosilactobacillus reuteri]|uniref:Antirepressor n=1 Tax=Limosilactobacillus reuteri TaxID=1598 RepID=A0A1C2G9V8_LIMRT|nr:phage antirepressor [Limosilactobacillus reuteri]MCC4332691.1 phage antirepressor [Limosilactobacillus reuteri]MCC4353775.1 phage antirepressor [Limosilactobacillus reuteri]OCX48170.1 antirepressor [Limosilactobacillus reuteri]WPC93126.1 phage antirepressor [Limosilactobacillus reuteri]
MKELQLFNFHGNQVRTVTIDNEPYFVGNDVSKTLGYSNYRNTVNSHVDDEDRLCTQIKYAGQNREVTVINESGLYSLILGSKLPTAKEFKHWVTSEVLPSIRKHGAYMTPQTIEKALLNPDTIINLATQLKEEQQQRKQLQRENEVMKPKALFADAVSTSDTAILVGQLAKILRQNDVEVGQNRLFRWMREKGYLGKRGQNYNMPTQYAMNLGLFEIKERTVNNPDGTVRITKTPMVTGKGQQYFINKFLAVVE